MLISPSPEMLCWSECKGVQLSLKPAVALSNYSLKALCWFRIVHTIFCVCLFSQTPGYFRAFLCVLQGPTQPLKFRINQSTRPVPGKASDPLFGGWEASLKIFLPRTAGNDVVCHNVTSGAVGSHLLSAGAGRGFSSELFLCIWGGNGEEKFHYKISPYCLFRNLQDLQGLYKNWSRRNSWIISHIDNLPTESQVWWVSSLIADLHHLDSS